LRASRIGATDATRRLASSSCDIGTYGDTRDVLLPWIVLTSAPDWHQLAVPSGPRRPATLSGQWSRTVGIRLTPTYRHTSVLGMSEQGMDVKFIRTQII
jgi:hypothetical protein